MNKKGTFGYKSVLIFIIFLIVISLPTLLNFDPPLAVYLILILILLVYLVTKFKWGSDIFR